MLSNGKPDEGNIWTQLPWKESLPWWASGVRHWKPADILDCGCLCPRLYYLAFNPILYFLLLRLWLHPPSSSADETEEAHLEKISAGGKAAMGLGSQPAASGFVLLTHSVGHQATVEITFWELREIYISKPVCVIGSAPLSLLTVLTFWFQVGSRISLFSSAH